MSYTSDDLLSDIKNCSFLPTARDSFSNSEILRIADHEIHQTIAPILVSFDDGFYLENEDSALVAGQSDYQFSRYAMWHKLRKLEVVESDGDAYELIRLTPDQVNDYNFSSSGDPQFFSLMHDVVRLYPTPSSSSLSLRQWIYRRPNRLVETTSAAVVQSVLSGVVTYNSAPPATFTSSSSHDFFDGVSPFRRIASNVSASAAAGSTQTFPVSSASTLSSGDYVCLRDETVFPAFPLELTPFLKDLVIRSLSRTNGDNAQYETQRKEIINGMKSVMIAPGQRVIGHPKKVSLNRSLLSGSWRIRTR